MPKAALLIWAAGLLFATHALNAQIDRVLRLDRPKQKCNRRDGLQVIIYGSAKSGAGEQQDET